MKFIEEVKKVGGKKYTRVLGAMFTMQELLEDMEECNYEVVVNEDTFVISNPTEYTILVGNKEVDAKDISISLYDPEDMLSDNFTQESTGDYVTPTQM